jgi:amino acid permease
MEQNQSSLFEMNLDAQNSYTLRNTASWAKVLGVVSIITGGLLLILGVIAQTASRSYSSYDGYRYRRSSAFDGDFTGMGLAVIIISALIYAASGFFALTAGNKINIGLKTNNMETLNAGFAGARNFFALWAILMIIMLLFLLLGILGNM